MSTEVEESPLLEATTYQRLVKTMSENLMCAVVICIMCRLVSVIIICSYEHRAPSKFNNQSKFRV
jgi:hypothetical protein